MFSQSCEYPPPITFPTLYHLRGKEHRSYNSYSSWILNRGNFAFEVERYQYNTPRIAARTVQVLQFCLRIGKDMAEQRTLTAEKHTLLTHQQQETEHQDLPRQEPSVLKQLQTELQFILHHRDAKMRACQDNYFLPPQRCQKAFKVLFAFMPLNS